MRPARDKKESGRRGDRERPLILHVLKSSIYSGAENVIISIIRRLSDRFDFVYVSSEGPIRRVLEKEEIPFRLLEHFGERQVRGVIREYRPDIVHAHDFSASVLCAAAGGGSRLISHLHYDPPWVRAWNLKSLAYAACRGRVGLLLTVSEKMFDDMVFAGAYRDRARSVGNPVDGAYIRRLSGKTPEGEAPEAWDLVFVGRLEEQKDPLRFIRLAGLLKERGWDTVRAAMLGDGRLGDECGRLIAGLGLEDNVRMEGFRENPYPCIAAARLLCVTSRWEGFGLAAAEANILGVPVLAAATAGSLEMFGEDAPEICRTDEEFVRKIELLRDDEGEYESWRRRSGERAEALDNAGEYAEAMAGIYEREIKEGRSFGNGSVRLR